MKKIFTVYVFLKSWICHLYEWYHKFRSFSWVFFYFFTVAYNVVCANYIINLQISCFHSSCWIWILCYSQICALVWRFPCTRGMGTYWQTMLFVLVFWTFYFTFNPLLIKNWTSFELKIGLLLVLFLQRSRPQWVSGVAGSLWSSRRISWQIWETGSQDSASDMWPWWI